MKPTLRPPQTEADGAAGSGLLPVPRSPFRPAPREADRAEGDPLLRALWDRVRRAAPAELGQAHPVRGPRFHRD
jgi:hypothetical protein